MAQRAWPVCHFPHQLRVTMAMQAWTSPTLPALASAVLSLLSLALLLLLCLIKKKRRMEGTYRPSAEERKQTGAAGPEKPRLPLPLPKEERLIWFHESPSLVEQLDWCYLVSWAVIFSFAQGVLSKQCLCSHFSFLSQQTDQHGHLLL